MSVKVTSNQKPATRKKRGKIFVISAPSGCGKTTLCRKLLADDLGLIRSVSVTTRPKRPDEKEGRDYRFVSKEDFERMAGRREFLEHEENFGYLYGTPKRFVQETLKSGKPVLLSIDVKGAMKVKKAYPGKSVLIFLLPPSIKALKIRLKSRMTDSSQTIATRLKLARREMLYENRYDHVVLNDSLDNAYRRLKKIVMSEKSGGNLR